MHVIHEFLNAKFKVVTRLIYVEPTEYNHTKAARGGWVPASTTSHNAASYFK
jgi:hypothetical protein